MRITVLGIGNVLMGDEGVGVHAIRALKEMAGFPEHVGLLDGGTMGLDLLPYIEGLDRLLIIDAVSAGLPPASIRVFEGGEVPRLIAQKFSVHQIGLGDLLAAATLLGNLPGEMCLVGVEPKTVELSLDLSSEIAEAFPALLNVIINKVSDWEKEAREARVPCDTFEDRGESRA